MSPDPATLQTLTPTARLIVHALAGSPSPLTIALLSTETGASPASVERILRKLTKRGLVQRVRGAGRISVFSLSQMTPGGAE